MMSMFSSATLIRGASVTLALSALRMYQYGARNYSFWCLGAGIFASQSAMAESYLPASVSSALSFSSMISADQIVIGLVSGLALEASLDGLQLSDMASASSLMRIGVGAAAALIGMQVGSYVAGMVGAGRS